MPLRTQSLAVLLVLALAVPAVAERGSDLLDDLEVALKGAQSDLASDTSDAGRKKLKAVKSGLNKLAKNSKTLKDDAKTLRKLAKKVKKKLSDVAEVKIAYDDALAEVEKIASDALDAAKAKINAAPDGRKKKAAQKAHDAAAKKLAAARAQTDLEKRANKMYSAFKAADVASQKSAGLPDGGGGGGSGGNPLARVVFPNSKGIYQFHVINLTTGEDRVISGDTESVSHRDPAPLEAPDGTHVAYVQGDKLFIWDGEKATQVGTRADWEHLSWSPDSKFLAASSAASSVFAVFNDDGTTKHSLSMVVASGGTGNTLVWSPDGKRVAVRIGNDGRVELRVVDPETGSTSDASGTEPDFSSVRQVEWTPDSQGLVFVEKLIGFNRAGELFFVDPAGTQRVRISDASEDVVQFPPRVQPDGSYVLYVTQDPGGRNMTTVKTDGTGHRVLGSGATLTEFAFSPDGTHAAFITGESLFRWAVGAATTPEQVSGSCPDFLWGPNGNFFFYREQPTGATGYELRAAPSGGGSSVLISGGLGQDDSVEEAYGPSYSHDLVTGLGYVVKKANGRQELQVSEIAANPPLQSPTKQLTLADRPHGDFWKVLGRRKGPDGKWYVYSAWHDSRAGTWYLCAGTTLAESDHVCREVSAFQLLLLGIELSDGK